MDTREIKVSVLCKAFNHGPLLRDALDSFVSQKTDFAFEVLVSDDASTDDTADVIREYAERYPELIRPFLLKENVFSQGIDIFETLIFPASRGEYLAICEGDDYWTDPDKLQMQVDFLDAHPDYSACVHNSLGHFMDGSAPDRVLFAQDGDRDISFEQVIHGMSFAFHTSSIVARREYLVNPPDFREVAFGYGFTDYPVGIWLTMKGKVRFLDRNMSVYRIGSNPTAWSSNVSRHYHKLKQFVTGEREMLRTLRPHLPPERAALVDRVILEREYELLNIEGKVEQMVAPPYKEIFRGRSLSHRLATRLKCLLPHLHRLYRKRRGYGDY